MSLLRSRARHEVESSVDSVATHPVRSASRFAAPKTKRRKTSRLYFVLFLLLAIQIGMLWKGLKVVTKKADEAGPADQAASAANQPKQSKFHLEKSLFTSSGQIEEAKVLRKTGQVVHKPITSISKNDIAGLAADVGAMTYEEALVGRERIVAILEDAGVKDIDVATLSSLPQWSSVTKLYGEGLERCKEFRETIPLDDASIGTAGMFNTGTNPFAMYIEENCVMPHNTHDRHGGTRWQVPWGKHTLASRRLTNTAGHDHKVNKTNVLPVVLVRDPYSWMQSMCKNSYAANWPHRAAHCPNLVPNEHDRNHDNPTVHVRVNFNGGLVEYDSLAHVWSDWYRQYYEADYPRLMVRFEDLQFHAREMIDVVCQCAGAVARKEDGRFTYIVDAGKWGAGHTKQNQTNMISAMIKYGTDKNRFKTMTKEDLAVAAEGLDSELMHLFQYELPTI